MATDTFTPLPYFHSTIVRGRETVMKTENALIRASTTIESNIIVPLLSSQRASLSARHRNEFASFSKLAFVTLLHHLSFSRSEAMMNGRRV